MTDLLPVRTALLSVSDKTDLVPFARTLHETFGIALISTGGTAKALQDAGLPVRTVDSVTGFPEIMDGRVKTLHPAVHGALLGRRDRPTHVEAMKAHDIAPIDLLVINLYPFEATVAKSGVERSEAIEQIDIGGPAMIRSGAKNHDFTCVVTDAAQYDRLITELTTREGRTSLSLRRDFAAAAFQRTAAYDVAIAAWMTGGGGHAFPELLRLSLPLRTSLRYGENPHQRAALYADPSWHGPSVVNAETIAGKPLSYNNLADAAQTLALLSDLHAVFPDSVAAAVIKHTNPCGASVGVNPVAAFEAAYAGDPVAAYGGILGISAAIDAETAATIADEGKFLEVILAPAFTPEATEILCERWKNVRLLAVGDLAGASENARPRVMRSIVGGMLVQDSDTAQATSDAWQLAAGPALAERDLATAKLAWTLVKHITSNAILIAAEGRMLGAGGGQVDRVGACEIAIRKAGETIRFAQGAVIAASDAFFPFADGPRALIDAGVTALIQPGGSMRDEETIALCAERGVSCYLTGVRHFRH